MGIHLYMSRVTMNRRKSSVRNNVLNDYHGGNRAPIIFPSRLVAMSSSCPFSHLIILDGVLNGFEWIVEFQCFELLFDSLQFIDALMQ